MALRFMSGGESHGPALVAVMDGLPAGLQLTEEHINRDLARRQLGYGRGARMSIEADSATILSGVRRGLTLGSPISLYIKNRDHENWREIMGVEPADKPVPPESKPRPGHGDLAGMLKYGFTDARNVLERASARETAARVAVGAIARRMLEEVEIAVASRVVRIGEASAAVSEGYDLGSFSRADEDTVRCPDPAASARMRQEIDLAKEDGDTLGGIFEVAAIGVVPGLGSSSMFDRRLDCRLFGALASIPGVKGVEAGRGFELGKIRGSEAHDEIFIDEGGGLFRGTNRAGGLEAGMTNGEPLCLRAVMKPIPTLAKPLATVDIQSKEPSRAFKERADVCAVPAAAVVGEAVVAFVLADAVLEKFGGDSMDEMLRNFRGYLGQIGDLWKRKGR